MNEKYRRRTQRILMVCEALLLITFVYSMNTDPSWRTLFARREGIMFAAGMLLGPALSGTV